MSFGAPGAFLLLLVVVALAGVAAWLVVWQSRARRRFAGGQATRWQPGAAWPRTLLLLAGACLLVFAAARPQWGDRELRRERRGVDIVVVLDVSQSMTAKDVEPSRLGLAQEALDGLLNSMRGSRVGLVFFSGSAIVRSPLTSDINSVVQIIRRAQREVGLTRPGSDISAGLDASALIFQGSDRSGKAVLVVSDGEDFGSDVADRSRELAKKGIAVFAAGVGTSDGGTMQEITGAGRTRTKTDPSGRPIITRLDETSLRTTASAGGGAYIPVGTPQDLLSLRGEFASLDQAPSGTEVQRLPVERFQWFLAAGLMLVAAAPFATQRLRLPALRRPVPARGAVAVVLVALLIGSGCSGDSLRSRNRAANDLYNSGDYEGALDAYGKLLSERPDVPELGYNAGNTLHRLGDYERAAQETQRALPPSSRKLGAATYYALGNHFFALGQLEQALDAYRNALLLDSKDEDAKYNLELTLLAMRLRDQQEQQPAPGPSQDGQQGEQAPGQSGEQGGQQQGQAGTPGQQQGQGQTQGQSQGQPDAAAIERSLREALAGLDDDLTFEEAIHILDLLRQQREAQQRPTGGQQSTGPDY